MFAEAPGDSRKSVRITTVEFITVVEKERRIKRLFGRWAPFKDLFSPIHSHISVHLSRCEHLVLRGVPIRVVRFCMFELLARVRILSRIFRVLGESFLSPVGKAGKGIVPRVIVHKVHREFAPDNKFFEKSRIVKIICLCVFLSNEENRRGRDVPEVQIGTHIGCCLKFGTVTILCKVLQSIVEKMFQMIKSLAFSSRKNWRGRDAFVDRKRSCDFFGVACKRQ